MKVSKYIMAITGAMLLCACGAFASETKGPLHLYETVTVQGKTLSPGDYKVEWTGEGSAVNVNILQGKAVVATTTAQVVTEQMENSGDGYEVKKTDSGDTALKDIFFSGKKYQIQLEGAASQGN